jgi:hypothetical protein
MTEAAAANPAVVQVIIDVIGLRRTVGQTFSDFRAASVEDFNCCCWPSHANLFQAELSGSCDLVGQAFKVCVETYFLHCVPPILIMRRLIAVR